MTEEFLSKQWMRNFKTEEQIITLPGTLGISSMYTPYPTMEKMDLLSTGLGISDSNKVTATNLSPSVPVIDTHNCYKSSDAREELNAIITDLVNERTELRRCLDEKMYSNSHKHLILLEIWEELCDTYDTKSSIKEVPRRILFELYKELEVEVDNSRDLTKKIKKDIEQMKLIKPTEDNF
jgi:hypothetical protein